MALRFLKGESPTLRFTSTLDNNVITKKTPEKGLTVILEKHSGRNNQGIVTVRHQGGRQKRFLRLIDFKRDKIDIAARVASIEYDPNRTANIALLNYIDGEKRYILHPEGLKVGDKVMAGAEADIKPGNAIPLGKIPIGTFIHNLELFRGRGGQLIRSAGSYAIVLSKEGKYVQVKFPSNEVRKIDALCYATIGQIGNIDWKNINIGKAGRSRHMGIRPTVRGVAQNPRSHPHGGGEGRSGIGMSSPKTPWGKPALGKKTRQRKKSSNKFIVQRKK